MTFGRNQLTFCIVFTYFIWKSNAAAGNSRAHIINQDPVIIIKEDTAVGTLVYTLIGDDPENDVMTYSLDATGTELFTLVKTENTKAELRLKKTLNRELTANYEFKAFVTDDVNNADKKTEKALFVTVLDANDNAPIFTEQPYRKSIAENTAVNTNLLTIKAVDADSAANAAVQYRFSNDSSSDIQFKSLWETDKFKIDNVNGHITLTGALDFEKTSRYVLTVIAEDRGSPPQKSETTVVFDVTDISDMPPKFEQSIYITEINENSPKNTSVIKVTARDGDTGVDNPIKYEIYQGNQGGAFDIDSSSGQITVNGTIDAENIQSYTLYIRASEVPDPSSNTTVKVLITVIDKNDNPPILSQHSYYFPVREDQAIPGRIVTNQLLVTDADRNPDYRRFTYALTGVDSTKFSINPNGGILKINSTLDYEKQINFTFTIVVTETGTAEKFSDNATVLLTLINVNDNEPKFQQSSYNYTFAEEIPAGAITAKITATDDDSGTYGEVTYSLKGLDVE